MGLFDTAGFVPRWHCGEWGAGLGWTAIAGHVAIAVVYTAIPLLLLRAARRRRELPFREQVSLFAAFIFCCGVSHAVNALIFWVPVYRFLVAWDVLTAGLSVYALSRLVPVIPQVVAMRSPRELEAEIALRERAEAALAQKVAALEQTERNLRHTNRDLQQTLAAKKLLEARVRELEACHHPDHTGTTPTQAAIARMNEATLVVARSLPPPVPSTNGDAY